MSDWGQDLRYALRSLGRAPGFTAAAVLTLALGSGATTTIFSAVRGVLLEPLPYRDADRVVLAMESSPAGGLRVPSYPTFVDWQARQDVFDAMGYTRGRPELYRGPEGPENRLVAYVSPGFFTALGPRAALGRILTATDPGSVAVLSHRWWRSGFGGDRDVLGRSISLGGRSVTVVGVAAPAARYPDWADAWIPLDAIAGADIALTQRGLHVDSRVIARLRPGVSPERARAGLSTIAARLAVTYPVESEGWNAAGVLPLRSEVMGFTNTAQTRLLVLAAAVALVLLIACANVASLLWARALTRGREFAIRLALGARRGRLARQLLTESLVLAGAGGLSGVVLAFWSVNLVKAGAPAALPRLEAVDVDRAVLAFSAGVMVLTALLVGLAPALRTTGPHLPNTLRGAGPGAAGLAHQRLRRAIVIGEIALAVVLTIGAGLLTGSLWRLSRVDPGFDPLGVLSIRVEPPVQRFPGAAGAAEFYRRVLDAATVLPGVQAAALTNHLPLSGGWFPSRVVLPGEPLASEPRSDRRAFFRTVSPGYLTTMRIPVLRGRPLADSDLGGAAVAMINETAARQFFADRDAIGQTVTLFRSAQGRPDFGRPFPATIVGIVGDVRHTALDAPPPAEVYVPYTVNPWGQMALIVRTPGDPNTILPALRRAILDVDPDVPVVGAAAARTTLDLVESSLAAQRLNTVLLGAFAGTAVLLSGVGIYGVIAYMVNQRRRELGIRMALGARPADIRVLVLRQGAALAAGGAALGLAAALALTRLLRGLLFGVTPTDPPALAAGTLGLIAVALLASYFPARRAARIAPMEALRHD